MNKGREFGEDQTIKGIEEIQEETNLRKDKGYETDESITRQ